MMNNKKITIVYVLSVLLALPAVTMAWTVGGIALGVQNIVEIVFGVAAIIYFLVYGIMFLMARGDPSKAQEARMGVLWGVVGVVVGVLALGIINAVVAYFGL